MIEKGIIDKVLCINNSLQSQRPELVSTFSLQKLRELKKSARKVTLYETAKLHKFEHPQNIIKEKINFFFFFFFFFLTAIWLTHGQLWAILKGTASLTRC